MKSVIVLFLSLVLFGCKSELKTESFGSDCYECEIVYYAQEPAQSFSNCPEFTQTYKGDGIFEIDFGNEIEIANFVSFVPNLGEECDIQFDDDEGVFIFQVSNDCEENAIENGFTLILEVCKVDVDFDPINEIRNENEIEIEESEKTGFNCYGNFTKGVVRFNEQAFYIQSEEFAICESMCVEIENGSHFDFYGSFGVCPTNEDFHFAAKSCEDFSPTSILHSNELNGSHLKVYFNSEFWECWNSQEIGNLNWFELDFEIWHSTPF